MNTHTYTQPTYTNTHIHTNCIWTLLKTYVHTHLLIIDTHGRYVNTMLNTHTILDTYVSILIDAYVQDKTV